MLKLILYNIFSLIFTICFLYFLIDEKSKFVYFLFNWCHNICSLFINIISNKVYFFETIFMILILGADISFNIADNSFSEFSVYFSLIYDYENLKYKRFVYLIFLKIITMHIKKFITFSTIPISLLQLLIGDGIILESIFYFSLGYFGTIGVFHLYINYILY